MSAPRVLKKTIALPHWCKCMQCDWEGYEEVPPACNTFSGDWRGYCKTCGHGKGCHTTIVLPANCKCDPRSWGGEPYPICDNYKPNDSGQCINCDHDLLCHITEDTLEELQYFKAENSKLKADIERVTGKPSLEKLIPDVVNAMMDFKISQEDALQMSILPHDIQRTWYHHLMTIRRLEHDVEIYEENIEKLKSFINSF